MNAKYLAEIKARDDADLPETAAPVFRDRHALIAEVERLTDIEKEYHHYRRLSEKLDQQIATLKRALELSCRYHNFDDFRTVRAEMDFFIHQAQEQDGNDG